MWSLVSAHCVLHAAKLTPFSPFKSTAICPVTQVVLSGVTPMQPAVTRDSNQSQLTSTGTAVALPTSIADLQYHDAQPVSSMHGSTVNSVKPSTQHSLVRQGSAAALYPATPQAPVERLQSCSASVNQQSSSTGRSFDTQGIIPTASSRCTDGARHVVTTPGTQQARAVASSGRQWYDSQGPQASLLSFDSAVPSRSCNSMTAQVQPRALSVSHPSSKAPLTPPDPARHQSAAAAAAAGRQQGCSAIEALRPDSKDGQSGDLPLSVDVSKISFRILTSIGGSAGQRGPCSPLTPVPDSPCSPLNWCR